MTRRRYRWNPETGQSEEVPLDYVGGAIDSGHRSEAEVYGDALAPGTNVPIDTRKRHREYLKATGGAMASDFKEHWAKARAQRDDFFTTGGDHARRRDAVERAYHQVTQGRKSR